MDCGSIVARIKWFSQKGEWSNENYGVTCIGEDKTKKIIQNVFDPPG